MEAVFTLVYASRESIRNVGGLIRPKAEGIRLARRVAEEQRLPIDWLCGDEADIEFLLGKIRPQSLDEVEELYAHFFPRHVLPDRTRSLVQRVIKEAQW